MAALDGTAIPVDLGSGLILQAPGLIGQANREPELLGGRADEAPLATAALSSALSDAGLEQVHGVVIDASEIDVAGMDLRGPGDEGIMVLQVPDLGAGSPQVLLSVDEAGIATWHFSEPATAAPGSLEFALPREVATADAADAPAADQRGLVGTVGRKLLSVLVFPAAEAVAGMAARILAERYESKSRPYRLRRFAPGLREPGDGDLAAGGWDRLDGGPALLFVHGTFSTCKGGFSGLPDETLQRLCDAYDGRVLAFDHPSLSATPRQNAARLIAMLPTGRRLDVDVIAHSRGGLVARALADAAARPSESPLTVRSTVFVATPNTGTALADDRNIRTFIDRMTTLLNLIPDGPWSAVSDVLAGVLDVVKVLAVGAVNGLPGLQAMDPADAELGLLGASADASIPRFAIDADFEPTGSLLSLVRAKDALVDKVFGGLPNDLVVPTDGVVGAAGVPGFPVPAARRHSFGKSPTIWHCSFFSQPATADKLLAWCRPSETRG